MNKKVVFLRLQTFSSFLKKKKNTNELQSLCDLGRKEAGLVKWGISGRAQFFLFFPSEPTLPGA